MKLIISLLLALSPGLAMAQDYQGMSQQDMQKMMQGAQQMQACMQKVDQAKLEQMSEQAQAMEREINRLCTAGKREQAQTKAMAFGMKMSQDPDMKQMARCGQMMAGMMPKMPFMDRVQAKQSENSHICD